MYVSRLGYVLAINYVLMSKFVMYGFGCRRVGGYMDTWLSTMLRFNHLRHTRTLVTILLCIHACWLTCVCMCACGHVVLLEWILSSPFMGGYGPCFCPHFLPMLWASALWCRCAYCCHDLQCLSMHCHVCIYIYIYMQCYIQAWIWVLMEICLCAGVVCHLITLTHCNESSIPICMTFFLL